MAEHEKPRFWTRQAMPSPGAPTAPPHALLVMGAMNASFVTDGMLFGIHAVLFAMCSYILIRRQNRKDWFVLSAICVMFGLSAADVGLSIKLATTDLWILQLPPGQAKSNMPPKAILFVTNNLVADILLFHRCWVIWGRPRIILWIALVCLTADSIWGYMGHATSVALFQHTFQPLYLWTVFALNIAVTAATAGRIYWISLVAISPNERRMKKICHTVISTLVESAALYSACIFAYLLWSKLDVMSAYWVVPMTMMTRLVAIMPTLMIVRLGMSRKCCSHRHHVQDSKGHDGSIILDTVPSMRMHRDDQESQDHVESRVYGEGAADNTNGGHGRAMCRCARCMSDLKGEDLIGGKLYDEKDRL